MKALITTIFLSAVSLYALQVGSVFLSGSAGPSAPTYQNFWIVGDSKSSQDYLQSSIIGEFNGRFTNRVLWSSLPPRDAAAGRSVYILASEITSRLSALPASPSPDKILFNLGANDVGGDAPNDIGDGVTWKTNLAFIFDSIHAKWPSAQIHQMRAWKQGSNYTSKLNTMNDTHIPAVHVGRSWCHLGPDERVFLEHGDDGLTMMVQPEGIHPNTIGQSATATAWKNSLFP